MAPYVFSEIESKWQDRWNKAGLFRAGNREGCDKRYILCMFPYPSGNLHMGHVINYTIGDVIARYNMMQGYDVMVPMGWDSFGLPAENAAIRENIHPSENIRTNIEKMKKQMDSAGWGFDWDRELATSSPDYYKWTQWLFLKFYEKGLAEQRKAPVNWCPNDQTVLANEQVYDGKCERCGTEVEQRDLTQWFFSMSEYAEKLLEGHKKLKRWPEKVLKMQKEWIGRSEGAEVDFRLEDTGEKISVYTTRPDTLFGVTFMSIAPQHPIIERLISDNSDKEDILSAVNRMRSQGTSEREMVNRKKEGVFTGKYVINPVNGERVPLWIANFVLMEYGTGIVMAVPTHDQRDFEFAQEYGIPLKVVITPEDRELKPDEMEQAYTDDGIMVNSGEFSGKNNREAMGEIIDWLEDKGIGKKVVNYKLKDWLISRQRYWGVPIPIVHCSKCGSVPVPEKELPVLLPDDVEFRPTGESPLETSETFMNTECPECGGKARRESDTMDTFVDSSWYYLRFASPDSEDAPFRRENVEKWCPVDTYIGGIEHATMHLIYFRFFAKVLNEMGLISFDEPVKHLFTQGMVCKTAHYCEKDKWVKEDQVDQGKCKICGGDVVSEMTKMSKTKLNVVDPTRIIDQYGADVMRMYILSDTPPDRDQEWSEEGVQGISRFINRLWDTVVGVIEEDEGSDPDKKAESDLRKAAHEALRDSLESYENDWQFNVIIARVMKLVNTLRKLGKKASRDVKLECVEIMTTILAPVTPHLSEEIHEMLGNTGSVFDSGIKEVDESALKSDTVTVVVQVNGKLRDKFDVSPDASKQEVEKGALDLEKVKKYTQGKEIKKVIVVPGKLVNIVCV